MLQESCSSTGWYLLVFPTEISRVQIPLPQLSNNQEKKGYIKLTMMNITVQKISKGKHNDEHNSTKNIQRVLPQTNSSTQTEDPPPSLVTPN